ncbi:MAG TPA: ribosome-associated translation inhibitor RaiA [Acidimicrobiales bacterium]|nr:ribosome-associated translation inhibitor RaiA [Acidimicrobiales bacterium]
MEIAVHGRHVELPSDVREHAAAKVEHLEKYLRGMERAEVLFSDGKKGHLGDPVSCEVTLEGKGRVVRAVAAGSRPAAALEAAVDKVVHRLTKTKTRLVGRSRPRHKTAKTQRPSSPEPAGVELP